MKALEIKSDERNENKYKTHEFNHRFLWPIFIGKIKEQINSSSTCNKHKKSRFYQNSGTNHLILTSLIGKKSRQLRSQKSLNYLRLFKSFDMLRSFSTLSCPLKECVCMYVRVCVCV